LACAAALLSALAAPACGGSSHDAVDAGAKGTDATVDSPSLPDGAPTMAFNAPDCAGCTFPEPSAPPCAPSLPPIRVFYPNDGVLVPPNMNGISVQWTPHAGYERYEVDLSNAVTDVRVMTKCVAETVDTSQPPAASGGCDLEVPPNAWTLLANANRGGAAVTVVVRGTSDGTCATTSAPLTMNFAQEDLLGSIYYWKSTVAPGGAGGQIWVKFFGSSTPEQQVTGRTDGSTPASCNGCHELSRDGQRMLVQSTDGDQDDEYGDMTGTLIDMSTAAAIGSGPALVQPPGFASFSPTHAYYVTSDGLATPPTNALALRNGNTGALVSTLMLGSAGDRPTMPDWSPDGRSIIYSLPSNVASWTDADGGTRNDDDHAFGASLYTVPVSGGALGTPSVFLQSGENDYYPSYSEDGQWVVFDRAPAASDSFSNPAARLMLVGASGPSTPVDLQKANGSPAPSPQPLSNSWPKWSPFVQTYNGHRLLWLLFSSTRDYGVLVRNHLPGMHPCYPPDSAMRPGEAHGVPFDALCQQPKIWMAAIDTSRAPGEDPSYPAFYLPSQDIETHNHTPEWYQDTLVPPPPADAGCIISGASCVSDPNGCCAPSTCNGNGVCVPFL
jgi:hypothetical protein